MRRALLLALLLAACRTTSPDFVLVHGKIFTADDARSWAEAVAIRGDRFTAVGTNDEVRALAGRRTKVIDLRGRTVVPGINDAHVHLPWSLGNELALPERATPEQVLAAIGDAAKRAPGAWIRAIYDARLIDDPRFTRAALDAIAPATPVRLTSDGGHVALLNTAALRTLGITTDRDGWLYENDLWAVIFGETEAKTDLCDGVRRFAQEAVQYGITSVQAMPSVASPAALATLAGCADVPIRIRWMQFNAGTVNEHPRMTQKYILDGTPLERGAAIRASYADRPGEHGWLDYSDAQIRRMLEIAATSGQPLLLHVSGDVALGKIFADMRQIDADWPRLRVRIEHGDFIDEFADDAQRFGVVVVQNPAHFTIPDLIRARYGDAIPHRFLAMRSLLERGIPVAIGSDGPVNPWLNVMFAIAHFGEPWEAITTQQAVVAYTRGSAYAEFAEKEKGTIAPGKVADLAVLSRDPFSVSPGDLPMTRSVMTIVGGKIVWRTTP